MRRGRQGAHHSSAVGSAPRYDLRRAARLCASSSWSAPPAPPTAPPSHGTSAGAVASASAVLSAVRALPHRSGRVMSRRVSAAQWPQAASRPAAPRSGASQRSSVSAQRCGKGSAAPAAASMRSCFHAQRVVTAGAGGRVCASASVAKAGAHLAVDAALPQAQRLHRRKVVRHREQVDALGHDREARRGALDGGGGGAAGEVQRCRRRGCVLHQVHGEAVQHLWAREATRSHLALTLRATARVEAGAHAGERR